MINNGSQLLFRNAYNLLGLPTCSPLKEIKKRSQLLLQLAKIGETQEFETDIGSISRLRNETEIKLATEKLLDIKWRLTEVFFWLEENETVNNTLQLIGKTDYKSAIENLENCSSNKEDWLNQKNLALVLLFYAFADNNTETFRHSLSCWKSIIDSDDFWRFYEKYYLLHDELGTSSDLFSEFKDQVYQFLANVTVAFYEQTKNPKVMSLYFELFNRIEKCIETQVLQSIIIRITERVKELKDIIDLTLFNADYIDATVFNFANYFDQLDAFELHSYSPIALLKNDTAEKLRSIAIDINNEGNSPEVALTLLDYCSRLAISNELKNKIEKDRETIKGNILFEPIMPQFTQILELVRAGNFKDACENYSNLDGELTKSEGFTKQDRLSLLLGLCNQLIRKGYDLFETPKSNSSFINYIANTFDSIDTIICWGNREAAIKAFDCSVNMLKERLFLMNIETAHEREALLQNLQDMANSLKNCDLSEMSELYKKQLESIRQASCNQQCATTQEALELLYVSMAGSVIYHRIKEVKKNKARNALVFLALVFVCLVLIVRDRRLSPEQKRVIAFMEQYEPARLYRIRKEGYSDKAIAEYILKNGQ